MIEHAGHQPAVNGIEEEQDVQDEQRHVALARIFQHQRRHQPAHDEIGRVPGAGARRAELVIFRVHVHGDGERTADIDRRDGVVGGRRQPRIQIIRTQRIQDEQHVGDRNECHRQQRRAASARPEIREQIEKEEDRDRIVDAVENDRRPRPGLVGHDGVSVGIAGHANSQLRRPCQRLPRLRGGTGGAGTQTCAWHPLPTLPRKRGREQSSLRHLHSLNRPSGQGSTSRRSWNPTSCPRRPSRACTWRDPDGSARIRPPPPRRASGIRACPGRAARRSGRTWPARRRAPR